jgi:hypothetical protein
VLQLHNGERVMADERFFLVKLTAASLSRDGWTAQEVEVMADHRWWSLDELAQSSATIWPENLLAMLNAAKAGSPGVEKIPMHKSKDTVEKLRLASFVTVMD